MFSKTPVVLAAGLLSAVYAQNGTFTNGTYINGTGTVTIDVYAATTTIQNQCSVCTPGATPSSYIVVVGNGVTTTLGGGAGVSPISTGTPSSLASSCFGLSVNGQTPLQQIADGQIQAAQTANLPGAGLTDTTFTLSNGMVYDSAGRICEISGQDQSQFQCNYVPTDNSSITTFSLIGSNLAFNGVTQFYQCLLGADGQGYNIYAELTGNQHTCTPITLVANAAACQAASTTTPVVAVGTPVVQVGQTTTLQPVVIVGQPTLPVIVNSATTTNAAATAIFVNSGATTKGSVVLAVASLFAYLLI